MYLGSIWDALGYLIVATVLLGAWVPLLFYGIYAALKYGIEGQPMAELGPNQVEESPERPLHRAA